MKRMKVYIVLGYCRIADSDVVKAVFSDEPKAKDYIKDNYWTIEEHDVRDVYILGEVMKRKKRNLSSTPRKSLPGNK